MKLKDAVFHSGIIGYGVSDSGLRFGNGDESAEHGLCYPRGEPLTLAQAVELKTDIGDDASVIAFFDGRRDLEIVELPELPIPRHLGPSGWRKGGAVKLDDLRRGHLLILDSMVHRDGCARNLVEVTRLPSGPGMPFYARFVEPTDPNELRSGANADGFAVWPRELVQYVRALPAYGCGEGVRFGNVREKETLLAVRGA